MDILTCFPLIEIEGIGNVLEVKAYGRVHWWLRHTK